MRMLMLSSHHSYRKYEKNILVLFSWTLYVLYSSADVKSKVFRKLLVCLYYDCS